MQLISGTWLPLVKVLGANFLQDPCEAFLFHMTAYIIHFHWHWAACCQLKQLHCFHIIVGVFSTDFKVVPISEGQHNQQAAGS